MKSHNHYEVAFQDFLRRRQVPYVAVDESKRALFRDARLKSFDFIVYSQCDANWLADVKGRRWAVPRSGGRPSWQTWATQADLDGLAQWQVVFGTGFRALLVFAYWIDAVAGPLPPVDIVHVYRDQSYIFAGVLLDDYRTHARLRSAKWGTVSLPTAAFRRHVRPMAHWL